VVGRSMPAALLSIWGSSAVDVYAVGGDVGDGAGPLVLHYDGASWGRLETGLVGNLWWVHGFADGPVFMGGDGGLIVRFENGAFTRMTTPGTDTVFGLWGSSPTDMWAVGGAVGGARGAFAWRSNGVDPWTPAAGFPSALSDSTALWKMFGRSASDAWIVGTDGATLRWDGSSLAEVAPIVGESLFTVHGNADRYVAVGGFGTGLILENTNGTWQDASPQGAPGFVGVHLTSSGGLAVGQDGAVYGRGPHGRWTRQETGVYIDETFHSVWTDPSGGIWAVGGQVLTLPLVDGILVYAGSTPPGVLP
jgi:hypothetical protein